MEKKKFSWGSALMCAAFLVLCIAMPAVGAVATATGHVSESGENRTLAEMPQIHEAADLLDFPEDFEAWYTDHLFMKPELVQLNSTLEAEVFGELDNDQVILGTEKPWMFYSADDGQPLQTYQKTNLFTVEQLADIAGNMTGLQADLADVGIDFVLMIAPDKEEIYGPDYMPSWITVNDGPTCTEQLLAYLAEVAPDLTIVYPYEAMMAAKHTTPGADSLYYETDTHWNLAGAWIGARELLDTIAAKEGVSWAAPSVTFTDGGTIPGDLQGMAQLGSDYDSREYIPENYGSSRTIDLLSEAGNGEVVWLKTEGTGSNVLPVSVYVSGDSFRWNLRDYLAACTSQCVLSSRYYLDTEDLLMQEPQVFVYEIAERYLHELSVLPGYNTMALQWPEPAV